MSDRYEQAGAHAEARTQTWTDPHSEYADGYVSGHMAGVEWADANPQPHTITRKRLREFTLFVLDQADDARGVRHAVVDLLGIEVEDDDEAYRVHAGGS